MTKAAQMFPIIMIVRQTVQITIIITTVLWIALKQVTIMAVRQLAAVESTTTIVAIMTDIIKVDNGTK